MDILIKKFNLNSLSVEFPAGFDRQILDAVKAVPDRVWNNELKLWILPDNQDSINLLLQKLYEIKLFNIEEKNPVQTKDNSEALFEIDKMKKLMIVRHYSEKTVEAYTKWVLDFNKSFFCDELQTVEKINSYLTKIAVKKHISASTQNQALAALLFYFRFVKNRSVVDLENVVHAKKI